jgi:hypothetical protein
MEPDGAEQHMLSGAILCFPAAWRLEEKLGRTLMRLNLPVAKHTEDVGPRVQRLMHAIRPETPMRRANAHRSRAPRFNPLSEAANRVRVDDDKSWIRCERRCPIRRPETQAVVFTIRA